MKTGKHVALVCPYGEEIERRWSSWEEMDKKKKWLKKVKDEEKEYTMDLVETFFSNLDLYEVVLFRPSKSKELMFQGMGRRCRAWWWKTITQGELRVEGFWWFFLWSVSIGWKCGLVCT